MKFHFEAIDGDGRPLRGVLAADSEVDAIARLRGEGVFPKKVTEADSEAKVTFAAKKAIEARRARGMASPGGPEDALQNLPRKMVGVTASTGFTTPVAGFIGLTDAGHLLFHGKNGEKLFAEPRHIESAQVVGFPFRRLRITLVTGQMYEFSAGFLLTDGDLRQLVANLNKNLKESP